MSANSVEKRAKITKADFISAVVYKPFRATNKSIAAELGISEAYFYKLLKKYSPDIDKELGLKKTKIRLTAISVIESQLNKLDAKTALEVLKQIGWSEPLLNGLPTDDINSYFLAISEIIKSEDTGGAMNELS